MPTSSNVERTLGLLLAKVEAIDRRIAEGDQRVADSNRRADEHRAIIHRRVDELVDEVGDVKTNVATMQADVADTKSVTDEFKMWKQRGIGALFVAGLAGTALGGVVVGFIVYWWDAIMRMLRSA